MKNQESKKIEEQFEFRSVRTEETDAAAALEQKCFPPNEACAPQFMKERIQAAAEIFLVAVDRGNGRIAGFLNGIATEEKHLRDEFFTDASLHDPRGKNIMLTGLAVLPDYRGQGLARELVERYAQRERQKDRERLVLTCLEEKVEMYRKFGFQDLGLSESLWGGEEWHEMFRDL